MFKTLFAGMAITVAVLLVGTLEGGPAAGAEVGPGGDRSIIIVSGRGGKAALNPQPLPPKYKRGLRRDAASTRLLNPQPLPPKVVRAK